ncbi:PAS domain containing protein [Trichomonas vaginalis G3]|uniref:PAS domain containing protein n=1 Tax=Trichomonas vaginalis (strain ATCC PRA-98 / G3) TaxID=412133 RepID=A2DC62_TRIV3|nr:adenylate cyclase type 1 family [Trichomonas vaginalis G3]EAY22103.1 PAS domain containing protein [Trichomonas vaginalis G3]KAI5525254.1 adenylate cyclase type 1 family [Trichomonas vaginalis G3]|eukprot:XP_001583089.1 PAS domain containing protein [Trichomonas vaginalis G3]
MQETKFPCCIMAIISIIIMLQTLSVGLWIYTPIFENSSKGWKRFYIDILTVFVLTDPFDVKTPKLAVTYSTFCIAIITILLTLYLIWYERKYYQIPKVYLYVALALIDIVDTFLIIPAVNIVNHGIISLKYGFNIAFVQEIVVGSINFIFFLSTFLISTNLKSRSVVITNLLFPLFDDFSITLWIASTSIFSLFSAIFNYYEAWVFVIGDIFHLLMTLYICYKLHYIPYYEVWRNTLNMAFCITSIALDINYLVLYSFNLTYNYTVLVMIFSFVLGYLFSDFYFKLMIKEITEDLTYDPDIVDVKKYLESIGVGKSPSIAMMYISVGLTQICDYFIDGSLTEYILSKDDLSDATSIILQILTFFPFESEKMKRAFKIVDNRRKQKISDKFLLYQAYRIRLRRLVSDTRDTKFIYDKLAQKTKECKNVLNLFWDKQCHNDAYLFSVGKMIENLDLLFRTAISDIPNNVNIMNLYVDFLIECKCDFDEAISMQIKADQIYCGKNFNVDLSFHSFVNRFPRFIKDHYLDLKGNKILRCDRDEKILTKDSTPSSSSSDIDTEKSNAYANKLIRDANLRMALHGAVSNSKPKEINYTKILTTVLLIINIFDFIFLFEFIRMKLEWRKMSYENVGNLAYSTFYHIYSNIYIMCKFASDNFRYDTTQKSIGNFTFDNLLTETLIKRDASVPEKAYIAANNSKYYLKQLLDNIAKLAEGGNPFAISQTLIAHIEDYVVCKDGIPIGKIPVSLKDQLTASNYMVADIAGSMQQGNVFPNIFQDNDFCQKMSNDNETIRATYNSLDQLFDFFSRKSKRNSFYFLLMTVIIPSIVFVLTILFYTLAILTYHRGKNNIIKSMTSISSLDKDEAKQPLSLKIEDSSVQASSNVMNKKDIVIYLPIFVYSMLIIVILVFLSIGISAIGLDNKLSTILNWYYFSCSRIVISCQLGSSAIQMILLNGSLPQSIISFNNLTKIATKNLEKMNQENHYVLYGDGKSSGSLGFDDLLDQYQLSSQCSIDGDPQSLHDMYACSSVVQQMIVLRDIASSVIKDPLSFGGNLDSEVASNLVHILRYHLYPNVIKVTHRIGEVMEETFEKTMRILGILDILGLLCSVICFILPFFLTKVIMINYHTMLVLLQHISPKVITESSDILEFFSYSLKSTKGKMGRFKTIIYNTNECIIVLNPNLCIEIVNDSIASNLDYSSDQMLGQTIINFVVEDEKQRLLDQLDLIIRSNEKEYIEDHFDLINENNELIPFKVKMMGIYNENNQISSIVLSLNNERNDLEKQNAANIAKTRSEKLLNQIIPKEILPNLSVNNRENTLVFQDATIIYIKVAAFNEYSENLSPSETMKNLSKIFEDFDKLLVKYPNIRRIKTCG